MKIAPQKGGGRVLSVNGQLCALRRELASEA
jgi:hypothetical protein